MTRSTSKAVFSDPKVLALCNCARGERSVLLIPSSTETNEKIDEEFKDNDLSSFSSSHSMINSDVLIHNSGWFFHSFHRHILAEEEIKFLCKRIRKQLSEMYPSLKLKMKEDKDIMNDSIDVNGRSLSLPPMCFGSDLVFIEGPLGSIQIDPIDALTCWIGQVKLHIFLSLSLSLTSLSLFSIPKSTCRLVLFMFLRFLMHINGRRDFKMSLVSSQVSQKVILQTPFLPPLQMLSLLLQSSLKF